MRFEMDRWCGFLKGTLGALLLLLSGQAYGSECKIAVLGDSLTASYGLDIADGFPAQLERALQAQGYGCAVLDYGVSGDTTAGGLARLDWTLADQPSHVILELGANDGLRGLPLETIESNLRGIVERARAEDVDVLLCGVRLPPSYGQYARDFDALYDRLAQELDIAYAPFFMEGVGGVAEKNLEDAMHPTPDGHRTIAANVAPVLRELLGR